MFHVDIMPIATCFVYISYNKPPSQCLDECDSFITKQTHFNEQVQKQLNENSLCIKNLHAT